MVNSDLISVVIPVWNGEKYIERCLKSILNQTYKNIEIIIVNDNSVDKTNEICFMFAQKYENIKIINLNEGNSGVSYSRNIGLSHANGEYVGFVDADDYLENNMYEKMYYVSKKNNADIVICDYFFTFQDNTKNKANTFTKDKEVIFNNQKALMEMLKMNNAMFVGHVWDKLYKKNIIDNVIFNEKISCFEDTLFNFEIMLKKQKILYINEALYNYCINKESVTQKEYGEKYFTSIKALQIMYNKSFNTELKQALKERIIQECIAQIYMQIKSEDFNYYYEKLRKILVGYFKDIIFNNGCKISAKQKVQIILIVILNKLFLKLISIQKKNKFK